MRSSFCSVVFCLLALGVEQLPAAESDPVPADPPDHTSADAPPLSARYREWIDLVDMLLTDEEKDYFSSLTEDFRRNAFIDAFWRQRDPYADTRMNEFQVHFEERVHHALSKWGTLADERARFYIRQGEPNWNTCFHFSKEIEVWVYDESTGDGWISSGDDLVPVLFFGAKSNSPYRRWQLGDFFAPAIRAAGARGKFHIKDHCSDSAAAGAMEVIRRRLLREGDVEPRTAATIDIPRPSSEWVASFASRTASIAADAPRFEIDVGFGFPGRHQQRTVVQGVVSMARDEIAVFGNEGSASDRRVHQVLISGEVVNGDQLFESFQYRYELPVDPSAEVPLAVVFQRYLRPGQFRVVLKVEDVFGRRFASFDEVLEVPRAESFLLPAALRPAEADSQLYRYLAEADAATRRGERSLRLLPPPGAVHIGKVRFQTLAVGDFERVEFSIDDTAIFTKRTPPFSVELDLGNAARARRVRVDGYAPGGERVAADEVVMNPGGQRFRVHITEPRIGARYERSLRSVTQVIVPEDEVLDRVELFLDENRIATLYQPPFVQPVVLDNASLAYVRAVAYLTDGNSTEDMVFINAPGELEEIDVHFIELFASVYDQKGRLISDLVEADFEVLEDGQPQHARRFEKVDNLPLTLGLLIDTSSSMEDSIAHVVDAASTFVEEVVTPRDRATLITFAHQPRVALGFTNDVPAIVRELEAIRASGGTAFYDSTVFALHYFYGVTGQKALLVLSDGEDEESSFDLEAVLAFAHRSGVKIFAIGIDKAALEKRARKILEKIAVETGGQAFFLDDIGQLPRIYASIQEELRSQYLFAYQSSSTKDPSEFRQIEVNVRTERGKRADVRTMSGYYP